MAKQISMKEHGEPVLEYLRKNPRADLTSILRNFLGTGHNFGLATRTMKRLITSLANEGHEEARLWLLPLDQYIEKMVKKEPNLLDIEIADRLKIPLSFVLKNKMPGFDTELRILSALRKHQTAGDAYLMQSVGIPINEHDPAIINNIKEHIQKHMNDHKEFKYHLMTERDYINHLEQLIPGINTYELVELTNLSNYKIAGARKTKSRRRKSFIPDYSLSPERIYLQLAFKKIKSLESAAKKIADTAEEHEDSNELKNALLPILQEYLRPFAIARRGEPMPEVARIACEDVVKSAQLILADKNRIDLARRIDPAKKARIKT